MTDLVQDYETENPQDMVETIDLLESKREAAIKWLGSRWRLHPSQHMQKCISRNGGRVHMDRRRTDRIEAHSVE
jgi:hypothetical protein